MVKAFFEGLILVYDCDVADFVVLVQAFNAVLDQLSQLDGALDRVRHSFDDDVVGGWSSTRSRSWSEVQKLVSSLEVPADTDPALNANFV